MFKIEDKSHAEIQKEEFDSYDSALDELKRRTEIPWDKKPNKCPCANWEHCSRKYEIVEYLNSRKTWKELSRSLVLEISAKGVIWRD